jgi:hypothetical protein
MLSLAGFVLSLAGAFLFFYTMLSWLGFFILSTLIIFTFLLVIRATTIPALRDYVTKFGEDAVRLFQTLEEGLRICKLLILLLL